MRDMQIGSRLSSKNLTRFYRCQRAARCVRLTVCLSVTIRCCVKTAKHIHRLGESFRHVRLFKAW